MMFMAGHRMLWSMVRERERPVSAYTSCVPSKNNSMHKQGEGTVAPVSNLVIKTSQEETYHLEHEERKARQGGPNSTVDVIWT